MDDLVESLFHWEGGGGILKKGLYGKAPPRGPAPYPFCIPFNKTLSERIFGRGCTTFMIGRILVIPAKER